eukprot:Seg2113.5 transcript_id=Seg2113.5/GoldUCD/mRNA.D3Y31 product="hypothetical protein" protein_id=Seg2113.5/GoldUCD/D3Y31
MYGKRSKMVLFNGYSVACILGLILQGPRLLQALRFSQSPAARISKAVGETVQLTWKYSITRPSELVRLECGYLNTSRQMTKLMEQLSTETQPRITVIGTRFQNRAYIQNGALVLTKLRAQDSGIYFCRVKAYDATTFQTVTIRSQDSYLSVGGPKSGGRSGMSSSTRTTVIAVVVVAVVLIIALFGYFFFRKRDRAKRRIPTSYDEGEDAKNGNTKLLNGKNGYDRDDQTQKRTLTAADIEVVSSPMEAVKKTQNGASYSSHRAYEDVEEVRDSKPRVESWPEPPTPTKSAATFPQEKSPPPSRAPPRVLPRPVIERRTSEDMFV